MILSLKNYLILVPYQSYFSLIARKPSQLNTDLVFPYRIGLILVSPMWVGGAVSGDELIRRFHKF